MRPVTIIAVIIAAEMLIGGINRAMAPFVSAFYEYGLYLSIAFIGLLWGSALDDRLHRMESQNKDPAPPGSAASFLLRSHR